jgi:hypothetical protein
MKVLINGCTATVRKYADQYRPHLGHLVQPRSKNDVAGYGTGLPWAADNDAIAGFDPDAYRRMLDGFAGREGCLFVTAPDHVDTVCPSCEVVLAGGSKACPDCGAEAQLRGDRDKTFDLFGRWYLELALRGLPVALVAQDGLTPDDLPPAFFREHPMLKAIFIGGSTEYKLSRTAGQVMRHCRLMGLWVHVGRVNSRVRMHHVKAWRADSCDGTAPVFAPDIVLPKLLRYAVESEEVIDRHRGFGPVFSNNPGFAGYAIPARRSRMDVDGEYLPRLRRLMREGASRADLLALNGSYQLALRAAG